MQEDKQVTDPAEAGTQEADSKEDVAGAQPPAETSGTAPAQAPADFQGQLDELKSKLEESNLQRDQQARQYTSELDRRVGQVSRRKDQEIAALQYRNEMDGLFLKAKEGDTDALAQIQARSYGAVERPMVEEAGQQQRQAADYQAQLQGMAAGFSYRMERLEFTDAEQNHLSSLFQGGRFEEVDKRIWEKEQEKIGGGSKPAKAAEKGEVAEARKGQGADLGGGGPGSKARNDRERKLDPTTPVAELEKIRARERAGG